MTSRLQLPCTWDKVGVAHVCWTGTTWDDHGSLHMRMRVTYSCRHGRPAPTVCWPCCLAAAAAEQQAVGLQGGSLGPVHPWGGGSLLAGRSLPHHPLQEAQTTLAMQSANTMKPSCSRAVLNRMVCWAGPGARGPMGGESEDFSQH